jgi:hypothetical protein
MINYIVISKSIISIMLKVKVSNPFTKKEINQGSATHKRVLFLQSLSKLNTTQTKIPNPRKGKPILVFGHSHINYLYNNFPLNEQNKIINDFKKKLAHQEKAHGMRNEIKKMEERHRFIEEQWTDEIEQAKKIDANFNVAKAGKLLKEMKKFHKEIEKQKEKDRHIVHKTQGKITKIKQNEVKEYNEEPAEQMQAVLSTTAFLGALRTYKIKPTDSNKFSFTRFFKEAKKEIRRVLTSRLDKMKALKVKLSYLGLFRKPNFGNEENPEEFLEERNFRSNMYEVMTLTEIDDAINQALSDLIHEIEEYSQNGSGWLFIRNIKLHINIYSYQPIRGSSFIELPQIIADKQACINIKNKDSKCFLYSIIAHDHPQKKNANRVSHYVKYAEEYKEWKKEYPMKLNDIGKFEEQFNKSINVYSYEIKGQKVLLHPLHITSKVITDSNNFINLLLVKDGENTHYVLIKSMSALLYQNYNGKGHGAVHLCPCCFKTYRTKALLNSHLQNGCARFGEHTEHPNKEKASDYVKFKSIHKMLKKPFIIYADFESILQPCEKKTKKSTKYQKHVTCSYAYKRVSTLEKYDKDIVLFRSDDDSVNVVEHFLDALLEEANEVSKIMKDIVPMNLTEEEDDQFLFADKCSLCGHEFSEDDFKVRDHDHLTGEYRGAAHNKCNLQYGWKNYKIPVIFHNLRGYDSHFIIKALNEKFKKIKCIPSSSEKFITFSVNNLEFIDSMSFIQASLERLVDCLSQNKIENINTKFNHFMKHFSELTDDQKLLLTQKGVYPYDFMDCFDKFKTTSFPTIEQCYSKLNKEDLDPKDYERATTVWKEFSMKNMGEYHDLYLKTDVLLLADVFENFRSNCLTSYKLDPVHYYTLPGFAWDACLLMTGVKLDVFSEEQNDMYLMVERGIRGGISVISHRHSKANNKYLSDFDKNEESKFIAYLDANSLYGWAMIQSLATGDFKWEKPEEFNEEIILKLLDDAKTGYIFDVDLEYPQDLHDKHNDYPLAADRVCVQFDQLSDHSKNVLEILGSKHHATEKLVPNLMDKENYVIHYRNLKLYLELGLKLKKINKVISFSQSPWLKKYIDFNTNKRKEAKDDFEKDMFKLMNNAVFGKTMENVRKRIRYELVNDKKRYQKLVNDVTFKDCDIISDNLVGISRSKTTVVLDKPIIVGFSVLELSKVLMYDFHYNVMKKRYGENLKLLFTDTDSLCYEIQTDDFYSDIKDQSDLYDFSEYPKSHMLYSDVNKKVIGKFKDETNSVPIREFVGLRSKMYSFKLYDNEKQKMIESKKAKGIKKNVVKREIAFDDYYRSLMGETKENIQQMTSFNCIRSIKHEVYSLTINKIGLCAHDDKRYLIDNINTYAHGHYKIEN